MEELAKIYYDPKTGFVNAKTLYQKAKETGLKIKYNDVKKWYDEQAVNQIFKKQQKVKTYNRIRSHKHQTGEMQGDLMDLKKYSQFNKGYRYLFNVIDIYSRYGWSFPIKNKTPNEIAPLIEKIFKQIPKDHYKAIAFDKGNEFMGQVNTVIEKYNIKKYVIDPHAPNAKNKMAMIERFNYTILSKIKKYMTKYDSVKYVDVLDDIVYNYNHSEHSMINEKPYLVFNGKEWPKEKGLNIDTTKLNKFKVGDYVRALKKRKVFDKKGFKEIFSHTVHQITSIHNNKYTLDNGKTYYAEELVRAKEGENLKEIKKKHKEVNKKEKKRLDNLKEHGVQDIQQFIREGKRVKKERKRYIEEM
jgi:hypothetical protein